MVQKVMYRLHFCIGFFCLLSQDPGRCVSNPSPVTPTVLIHPGSYNKISQTGWLINNRNLLLPVLEAGNSRSWYQYGWVLGKVFF